MEKKEMNKYDFIIELLERKELNSFQKEKILRLTAQEIKNESNNDEEILERIKKIETKLNLDFKNNSETKDIKADEITSKLSISDLPKYESPSNLSNFLYAYNQDPILKYTCHEIDDNEIIDEIITKCGTVDYDLVEHQKLIVKSFKALLKNHKINKKIWALINSYLDGGNEWSSEKIKINWKSPELIDWGKNNPGLVPNPGENLINKIHNTGFILKKSIQSNLTEKRISSFSKLVIHFKHLFHIKGDNTLRDFLLKVNENEGWNDKIEFELNDDNFWLELELFTDVDKVIQSYKKLINMILEVASRTNKEKPIIELFFHEEGSDIIFAIHHKNSVYQKTLSNTLDRIGQSQTELIGKQINGLCDLYLKADFGHKQYAEINMWDGNDRQSKELDYFEGVKFILKFKK